MKINVEISGGTQQEEDDDFPIQEHAGYPKELEVLGGPASLLVEFYDLWTKKDEEDNWIDLDLLDQEENYETVERNINLAQAVYELRPEHHHYKFIRNAYLPTQEQLEAEFGPGNENQFVREPLRPILFNKETTEPPNIKARAELFRWDGMGVNTPLFHMELVEDNDDKTLYKIINGDYTEGFTEGEAPDEIEYSSKERKNKTTGMKRKSTLNQYSFFVRDIRKRKLHFVLKEYGSHSICVHQCLGNKENDYTSDYTSNASIEGLHGIFWEQLDTWDAKARNGNDKNYKITKTPDYDAEEYQGPILEFIPGKTTKLKVYIAPRNWFYYAHYYSPDFAEEIGEGLSDLKIQTAYVRETYGINYPLGFVFHNVVRNEGNYYNHIFCFWDRPPHNLLLPRLDELNEETEGTIKHTGWKIPASWIGGLNNRILNTAEVPDYYNIWWSEGKQYAKGNIVGHGSEGSQCWLCEMPENPELNYVWCEQGRRLYVCTVPHIATLDNFPGCESISHHPAFVCDTLYSSPNGSSYWKPIDPPHEFGLYLNTGSDELYTGNPPVYYNGGWALSDAWNNHFVQCPQYTFFENGYSYMINWGESDFGDNPAFDNIVFNIDYWSYCDEGYAKEDYGETSQYTQAKNGIRGFYLYNFLNMARNWTSEGTVSTIKKTSQYAHWSGNVDWDIAEIFISGFNIWHAVPNGGVPSRVVIPKIDKFVGGEYYSFRLDGILDFDVQTYPLPYYPMPHRDDYPLYTGGAFCNTVPSGKVTSSCTTFNWVYTPPNGGRFKFGDDYSTLENVRIAYPEEDCSFYLRIESTYSTPSVIHGPFYKYSLANRDLYEGSYDEDECENFDLIWNKIENNNEVVKYEDQLDLGSHPSDPVPYLVAVALAPQRKLLAILKVNSKSYYVWRRNAELIEDLETFTARNNNYLGHPLFGCREVFNEQYKTGHISTYDSYLPNKYRTIEKIKNCGVRFSESSHSTFLGYNYDYSGESIANIPWFFGTSLATENPITFSETIFTVTPNPVIIAYRERARFDTGIGATRWANVFHYNESTKATYGVSAENRNRDRSRNPTI